MKILFTGASSLTGMCFVDELAKSGHTICATFQKLLEQYKSLRRERVEKVLPYCTPIFECSFGSPKFLELIKSQQWDLFCHHAADVKDYRSLSFDYIKGLSNNTHNIVEVLRALKEQGCRKILLTGSVFEPNEGSGSENLRAVSPYGLSKGLTFEVFNYYSQIMKMKLGKFVIPNPFGPYEEGRFTNYLIDTWMKKEIAQVRTPEYVRDNIHTTLLAKAYVDFAEKLTNQPGLEKTNPSGYLESQGDFTERFANEMRKRLSLPCKYELKVQTDWSEPKERVNTNPIKEEDKEAWDQLANYYQQALVLQ